ncbi:hypothetical protein [Methylophilus sp. QUAN]|nr:hypothetical protein [Methylophilus sp. QUAN]
MIIIIIYNNDLMLPNSRLKQVFMKNQGVMAALAQKQPPAI